MFDLVQAFDARTIKPQVTWGTSPEMVTTIDGRACRIPISEKDPVKRRGAERALTHMGLQPNTRIDEIRLDKIFIGSCTNSRIEDPRAGGGCGAWAARGAEHQARPSGARGGFGSSEGTGGKSEGLDKVFTAAGFEWR